MKKWNTLYDTLRFPIKLLLIAFLFIEFGTIIHSKGVNIFYNLNNVYLTLSADILKNIGQAIITNFPLIVIVRLVSRRAKSGTPILIGIIGYITFLVFTMMFQKTNISPNAVSNILGISYSTIDFSKTTSILRYPLQTGLIGAFVVGFITRFSYVKSRRRNAYSLLAFLDKDTVGYIYNIFLCGVAGILISFVWPHFLNLVDNLVKVVSSDISSPKNLFTYGFLDRVLSMLGLGDLIRKPFWFGAQGGSFSTFSGETVLGDVNIFTKLLELNKAPVSHGRFITPYYVINMFIVPAIVFGLFISNNRKSERNKYLFPIILYMAASFVCGNPLPLEMLLLFAAPLLYFCYLGLSVSLFGLFQMLNIHLGFSYSGNSAFAMPGAFADFIILIRNVEYHQKLLMILAIGVIYALVALFLTQFYVHYLAFDLLGSGRKELIAQRIIDALGGAKNIKEVYSNPFKLSVVLNEQELISINKLQRLEVSKIAETNEGVIIYSGMSSTIIRKQIVKYLEILKRD